MVVRVNFELYWDYFSLLLVSFYAISSFYLDCAELHGIVGGFDRDHRLIKKIIKYVEHIDRNYRCIDKENV